MSLQEIEEEEKRWDKIKKEAGTFKPSVVKSYNRYSESQAVAVALASLGFTGMEFTITNPSNTKLKKIYLAQARFVRAGNNFPVTRVTVDINNFELYPNPITPTGIPGFNTNDSFTLGFNQNNVIEVDIPLKELAVINGICWLLDGTAGFQIGDNVFLDMVFEMETIIKG